ncbi:HET-domain-containing protein [Acephala macrosclerotiorum]|nr:HET-domain-containing protein [Acephala macrosclerotiorum]
MSLRQYPDLPAGHSQMLGRYEFPAPGEPEDYPTYPWIRPQNEYDSNTEDPLCRQCQLLNFQYLFDERGEKGIYLGRIQDFRDVEERRTCKFCQQCAERFEDPLTNSTGKKTGQQEQAYEVYLNSSRLSAYSLDLKLPKETEQCLPQTLEVQAVHRFGGSNIEEVLNITFIKDDPNHEDIPDIQLDVAQARCDSDRIQAWIKECETYQPLGRVASFESYQGIRFINIERLCLVQGEQGMTYAALSYVWGGPNPRLLAFSRKSPASSHDTELNRAVYTVQNQILWVDALCIIQDSSDPEKALVLRQMHRIYENAKFTIVAASGNSCHAGLHGITERQPRRSQLRVQGQNLILLPARLDDALLQSYWITRAWTFQEYLLSSRKLVFRPDQIYFACPHDVCSESIAANIHGPCIWTGKFRRTHLGFGIGSERDQYGSWELYRELVSRYTPKSLSVLSDVEDAFGALSAVLSTDYFASSPFKFGIPMSQLDRGLLWKRCNGCSSCSNGSKGLLPRVSDEGFPTWSWMGWIGHILYSSLFGHDLDRFDLVSRVKWTAPTLHDWHLSDPVRSTIDDYRCGEDMNIIERDSAAVSSSPSTSDASPQNMEQVPIPIFPTTRELCLVGEVAEFIVLNRGFGQGVSKESVTVMHKGAIYQGFTYGDPLRILEQATSNHVGVVYPDQETIEKGSSVHTFIKLSQTSLKHRGERRGEREPNILEQIFDIKK